jgi:ABC-type sugar transport system substrate-binding protein
MNRLRTLFKRWIVARALAALSLLVALSVTLAACAQGRPAEEEPLTIGIINASAVREVVVQGFKDELARLGYAEGEQVRYRP